MNIHVNVTPMTHIIALLRDGRLIDAIKEFRVAYGSGLKEAKDAIEAIKAAFMPNGVEPTEYVVLSRFDHDYDYNLRRTTSKADAMVAANSLVDAREETIVARVIARSVTTRTMKEAA